MPTTATTKIDLYKRHRQDYVAPREPVFVDTTPGSYLMVDGEGPPGAELFQARVGALFAVTYTVKFRRKAEGEDFGICKLEGLYGASAALEGAARPEEASWTLAIRVPETLKENHLKRAASTLREKGKEGEFDRVYLGKLDEGRCVQMLHLGPYEKQGETLAKMHERIEGEGLATVGLHHEIYLSDPRRVPPERLRTILRQPVG